ncbi:MAG: hypothetical protein WA208_14325, partial [Thermoanaerobaculia bacterium]
MPARTIFGWIAVAVATAIRLYAGAEGDLAVAVAAAALGAVAILSIAALVVARETAARVLAVFLLLVAIVDVSTHLVTRSAAKSFARHSAEHLAADAGRIRGMIKSAHHELDLTAASIAAKVPGAASDRAALFRLLEGVRLEKGRGARILAEDGIPLAWWGEEFRAPGEKMFQFDVTNLYLSRSRPAGGLTVHVFERIENIPPGGSRMQPRDAWIAAMIFHGGFLKRDAGRARYLVERTADSELWIDVTPRTADDVIGRTRKDGANASALLLAAGALAAMVLL